MKSWFPFRMSATGFWCNGFWCYGFLAVCWLHLSVRLYSFLSSRAVNLLYSDQWAYLAPLFNEQGFWARFWQQHGPHRQGIALVISGWILEQSNWNSNYDSRFMIAVLICSAAALVVLACRLRQSASYWDVILLLLVLSPLHYETIILAPNSAHSVVPFLLQVLAGLSLCQGNRLWGMTWGIVCGGLLVFTGFGIFSGYLLLALLSLESAQSLRSSNQRLPVVFLLAVLSISLLLGVLYFWGYQSAQVSEFSLAPPTTLEYLRFATYFWAGVFQIRPPYAFPFGAITMLALVVASLFSAYRGVFRCEVQWRVVFFFLGSSLLYCTALMVGRITTGADFAQGSRYMLLAGSGVVGFYFYLQICQQRQIATMCLALLLCLALRNTALDETHSLVMSGFQNQKRNWLKQYSPNLSLEEISRRSGVVLLGATPERFQYLQARTLHFPK